MATKKKAPAEEMNTAAEEVKAATEEANTATEEVKPNPIEAAFTDAATLSARLTLDRMRQNAVSSRHSLAWERYIGAREMAESLGYEVTVVGERFHVLTKKI